MAIVTKTFDRSGPLRNINSFLEHTKIIAKECNIQYIEIIIAESQNYILWVEMSYKIVVTGDSTDVESFNEKV